MEENLKSKICRCHHIPPNSSFKVGEIYNWNYMIDGITVRDNSGKEFAFGKITFLYYFTKIKEL